MAGGVAYHATMQTETPRRLTLKQAAEQWGVKERTLLRRCQAGKLDIPGPDGEPIRFQAGKFAGPRGPEWHVWQVGDAGEISGEDLLPPVSETPPAPPAVPSETAVQQLATLIETAVSEQVKGLATGAEVRDLATAVSDVQALVVDLRDNLTRELAETQAERDRLREYAARPWYRRLRRPEAG